MRATVIIPVYNREDVIDRAIESVAKQGLSGWEVIVVDDASTDNTREEIKKWTDKYPQNVICLKFKDHLERVHAFNAGLRYARGDWVIFLDSDDELASHFIKSFEDARELHPNAMVLNWGSIIHWRNQDGKYTKSTIRNTFRPPIKDDGTIGLFRAGEICSGGYGFDKRLLTKNGFLTAKSNPFSFGETFLNWYPEVKPLYNEGQVDIGNPWGQDYAYFYHLTRDLDEKKLVGLEQILHIQHVRL